MMCLCVGLDPAISADWLPSCAPAACVSVAVEHSVTCSYMYQSGVSEADLALPRSGLVSAVYSCPSSRGMERERKKGRKRGRGGEGEGWEERGKRREMAW